MPADMKNMIAETFLGLACKKSIDKITVKDLAEECNISRQSFYYHFQDILDVLEWILDRGMQKAIEKSITAPTLEEAIAEILNLARDKHDIIEKLHNSQKREFIVKLVLDGTRKYLRTLFKYKAADSIMRFSEIEVKIDFCAYGITGLLVERCRTTQFDVDKLAGQIVEIIKSQIVFDKEVKV